MSYNESETSSPPLLISTLDIQLSPQSRKEIETIVVNAGDFTEKICQAISPGSGCQKSFNPPLEVLLDAQFSVSAHFRKTFSSVVTISLNPRDILHEAHEEDGKQLYRKTKRNVEVVIGIQSLPSTIRDIMTSCSKFRVLIIGATGVGKSTLINKVFGVAGVDVSETTRGQASIDQEHIASDNQHFIVHDSCGFEAADEHNFDTACRFISGRRRKPALKDQLHAIWLCLAIPFAGGRLLEAGVEKFLRNRKDILGNVPLVIVFTKLDTLVNTLEANALENEEPIHEAALNERTSESLERLCLAPIQAAVGSDSVSHVAVSTKTSYEETLATLVNVTTNNIQTYFKDEAAHYAATIAQRVNITLKVASTIAIGEKRYWKALAASSNFQGHTMKECLHVIHKDIVTVWNFNSPDHSLDKDVFKAALLDTPDLRLSDIQTLPVTLGSSANLVATLLGIIAAVAGTGGIALPIVASVAGIAILSKLAHDLYRSSHNVVRRLMAYIVDMTCVMQIIFLLAPTRNGIVDVEVVGIAMQAYVQACRGKAHADINEFRVNLGVLPGRRDDVLDKIKELIKRHGIGDNLPALRRELQRAQQNVSSGSE